MKRLLPILAISLPLTAEEALTDTRVVEVKDIADRKVHPVSMMPEGLLQGLSEVEVRDLVGYLQGTEQVELP